MTDVSSDGDPQARTGRSSGTGASGSPAAPVAGGSAERALDPAERVQHALELALRQLNRRDRTTSELRRHLEGKDVAPEAIDAALEELAESGYVDDARYARRFAEDRRRLDAWGTDRIERRLREAGIPRELIADALAELERAGEHGTDGLQTEFDTALALLARRFPQPPEDARGRDRALGLLVRRGYDLELARDVIRAHGRGDTARSAA